MRWAADHTEGSEQLLHAADAVLWSLSVDNVCIGKAGSFQLAESTHSEPALLLRAQPAQIYILEIHRKADIVVNIILLHLLDQALVFEGVDDWVELLVQKHVLPAESFFYQKGHFPLFLTSVRGFWIEKLIVFGGKGLQSFLVHLVHAIHPPCNERTGRSFQASVFMSGFLLSPPSFAKALLNVLICLVFLGSHLTQLPLASGFALFVLCSLCPEFTHPGA